MIKELWHVPTKELQLEADSESTFKEILIQKIVKGRGMGNVNGGYIRKLSSKG